MNMKARPRTREEFEIAIICALPLEANAVLCSLDDVWHDAPPIYGRAQGDRNHYRFGRSGNHPVVVVTLPGIGNVQSAGAAASLGMSFVCIQLALLVGICGAVPYGPSGQEIILGDVIVSEVLVRLDFGRQYPTEYKRKDTILDAPGKPNEEILGLLQHWKSPIMTQQLHAKTMQHLVALMEHPKSQAEYPTSPDQLFDVEYIHQHHIGCVECSLAGQVCAEALHASCDDTQCNPRMLIHRTRRSGLDAQGTPDQKIHFGSIGTADTVMKSALHRNELATSTGIIAFEMEGAGVWDKFNCLIIKGVCDYADSHKNKKWQDYAAAVAAAVAKEVLGQYVSHDRPKSFNSRFRYLPQGVSTQHIDLELLESRATPDSISRDIFEKIVRDYKKSFAPSQLEAFQATDLRTFQRDLKRIQDEQQQAKDLRNMRRIEIFMKRFNTLGLILDGLLGSSEIMHLIWGSARALFRISRGHNELIDGLLSSYEKMGEELPLLQESPLIFEHHIGLQRLLAQIFANVMLFHVDAMKIYSGQALKAVFKALWDGYKSTFANSLRQMRSFKTLIEDRAQARWMDPEQASMDARETRRLLQQVENDTLKFEQAELERREKWFHKVQGWIAATETETEHNTICHDRNRYQNSGSWILDVSQVKGWIHDEPVEPSSSIIWINGRPGAGKTYLASVLIEACLQKTDWTTCYFYCSEKTESKGSPLVILRSILFQLLCAHNDLVPYCHAKMKSSLTSVLSDFPTLNALLGTFFERTQRCFVVIDGLDECDKGGKDVLGTLRNLVRKADLLAPGRLRVAFFSRPSPEIKKSLPEAQAFAIEPERTRFDIEKYCHHRTRELVKFDFERSILKEVIEKICVRADGRSLELPSIYLIHGSYKVDLAGIFLFAKLVIDNLAKQPNRRRFQAEIDTSRLPRELSEAYTRIMERLNQDLSEDQLEYTELLLGWLVCSKRPMKWTEIQVALSIDLHSSVASHELDMDLKLRDDVQELCGSLVQILEGNRVELVHSTAKLFIVQQSKINVSAAECDLTLRCLRYLTLDLFRHDISDSQLREHALRGDLAFQDYAVSQWYMHMRTFVKSNQAFLETEIDNHGRINSITRELDDFAAFYGDNISRNVTSESSLADCVYFQPYPFHGSLLRIWDHICFTQRGDIAARDNVSLEALGENLTRNRALLEELSSDPRLDLTMAYDDYPFRCPKVLCFYFHEGFKNADIRDNHVSYHDLPFQCPIDECSPHILGFRSKYTLRAHLATYHPLEADLDESFSDLSRRRVESSKHHCEICDKYFRRANILDDHMRAHRGDRRFGCSECPKRFVRKNDLNRHQCIHQKRR
ncbi:unnamed protein product [Penicillium salamii]|nr:unnamed protein product [Penicillium salamii]